jgi:opacity protein-like surface antigen
MKRYYMVMFAVAVAVCMPPSPARAGFGFRVNGGLAYVTYSDFNDFVEYVNETEFPALGITDRLDNIHWVPEVNGEVLFSPVPSFTIGVGAGYISGKSEFSISFIDGGYMFETMYKHTVKAYPLSLNGYFDIPVPGMAIKPYLQGGIAAVYSKITFDFEVTVLDGSEGLGAELTTWGFAMHGGGGVKFAIFPKVSIDLGIRARWANLKGYEGTGAFLGEEAEDVFLAKEQDAEYFSYGPESVENKGQYEEGSVNLSGFAVTLGVAVSF